MNHIRWIAWGVLEIDNKEKFDRQQRRNLLRKMRAELAQLEFILQVGGNDKMPWYRASVPTKVAGEAVYKVFAGVDACRKICGWILEQTGDTNVGGADGGVRSAGVEAEGNKPSGSVS